MSYPTVPSNGRAAEYLPCQSWCFWRHEGHHLGESTDDDNYCHRPVGREVIGVTLVGHHYEISACLVYARLPVGSPDRDEREANTHHRNVVQLDLSPYDEGLNPVAADLKPGDARSLAAALIHGADLAEGMAR